MASAKQSTRTQTNVADLVAHPLRARCLILLAERVASPSEIRHELGVPIGDVSYHVKRLYELGAIELIGTQQVRGAVEHFYRAVEVPLVSDEEMEDVPLDQRLQFAAQICSLSFADASTALEERTFVRRSDYYVTRTPLPVDEQGWRDVNGLYAELLEGIFRVKAESAERMSMNAESKPIHTTAVAMFFEMPEPKRGRK